MLSLSVIFHDSNFKHCIHYTMYYLQALKMSKEKNLSPAFFVALEEEEHLEVVQVRLFSRVVNLSHFLIDDLWQCSTFLALQNAVTVIVLTV